MIKMIGRILTNFVIAYIAGVVAAAVVTCANKGASNEQSKG